MPTITKVKPQKNKKRVNIYLDGKFAFGLDLDTFTKYNLKAEKELNKDEIEKIVKESEFQTVYQKLLKYTSLRPRSRKEIKDWLRKHKVHKSLHEELFSRLKRLEMIGDEKFAVWWIEQRKSFKPRGKYALRQELRKKGIDKKTIEEVLDEADIDEMKTAEKLIEKKFYKWKKYTGFERRKKISAFLARKGFSWDVIRKALEKLEL